MHTRITASVALAFAAVMAAGCSKSRSPAQAESALLDISPYPGEQGVAIRRETVLRFDAPIAALDDGAIEVTADGQPVATNLHIGADGLSATAFYPQGLPGTSTIEVTVRGDRIRSADGPPPDVDQDGLAGGTRILSFETLDLTPSPGTDVCGRVFASERDAQGLEVPLAGIIVSVDGLELSHTTFTDGMGNFCLRDVPAGRIFVHIDGTTAPAPAGHYYPSVSKPWESRRGERISVGTVYLPAIAQDALQAVSQTNETVVQLTASQINAIGAGDPNLAAALANVALTVPADSLFSDDGTRGGSVGLAYVDPTRLPDALPPNLALPLVVTVQTDGARNFDRPVPICLPNLPDPNTGERLPPDAKTALWSFNHDTGRFEIVGPMTVSRDGELICSDPGVGLTAPGWHGAGSGTPGNGGPGNDDDDGGCTPSFLDLLKTAWRAARAIVECGARLTKAEAKIRCVLSAVDFIDATQQQIRNLITELENNGLTVQSATVITRDLLAKKNEAIAVINDCAEGGSPISIAQEALGCARSLVDGLASLCSLSEPCLNIAGQARVCQILSDAEALIDRAQRLVESAENILQRAIAEGICLAVQEALSIINDYLNSQNPGNGSTQRGSNPPMSAQDLARLIAELRRIADLPDMSPQADIYANNATGISAATIGIGQNAAASFGSLTDDLNSPVLGEQWVVLEFDALGPLATQRFETAANGSYRRILPGNQPVFEARYDHARQLYGEAFGITSPDGQRTDLDPVLLRSVAGETDSDGDGLIDLAEHVLATDPNVADTDGDGVDDGAELDAGTDPLDGVGGRPRVLDTAPAPGTPMDVCGTDGAIAMACGDAGLAMFNVYQGMAPALISAFDTPGSAQRVACAGALVALADGTEGLAILDARDPAAVTPIAQVPMGDCRAVAARGSIAYGGSASGRIVLVDMPSGAELANVELGLEVRDLQVRGDYLYVLHDDLLQVVQRRGVVLQIVGSLAVGRDRCTRLFAGEDVLIATHWTGFVAMDLSADPAQPTVLASTDTAQRGWRHMVLDGSGYGIGIVGPNANPDPGDDLNLYGMQDLTQPGSFLRDFASDGLGSAVPAAAASYDGLAYLADRNGALIVVRYLMQDLGTQPPSLDLQLSPSATVEEGKTVVASAQAADDVQVRAVDFFINGVRFATDSTYPFEFEWVAPARSVQASLSVSARAYDTGGNSFDADDMLLEVTTDVTAPELLGSRPGDGGVALVGQSDTFSATFSEPLDPATVSVGSLSLLHAGPDMVLDTADDVLLPLASAGYRPALQGVVWTAAAPFPAGPVRASLGDGQVVALADAAGNVLAAQTVEFDVIDGLVMTMYSNWNSSMLSNMFDGRPAETFTVRRPGESPESVTYTLVPNIDYSGGSGSRLDHRSGVRFTSPNGRDSFAWLVEGVLNVPTGGDFTFRCDIDDQFVLEIDGQRVFGVTSGCRVSSINSPTVNLSAGAHSIRFAGADLCSCCVRAVLRATGPGISGGVIPASWFGR